MRDPHVYVGFWAPNSGAYSTHHQAGLSLHYTAQGQLCACHEARATGTTTTATTASTTMLVLYGADFIGGPRKARKPKDETHGIPRILVQKPCLVGSLCYYTRLYHTTLYHNILYYNDKYTILYHIRILVFMWPLDS